MMIMTTMIMIMKTNIKMGEFMIELGVLQMQCSSIPHFASMSMMTIAVTMIIIIWQSRCPVMKTSAGLLYPQLRVQYSGRWFKSSLLLLLLLYSHLITNSHDWRQLISSIAYFFAPSGALCVSMPHYKSARLPATFQGSFCSPHHVIRTVKNQLQMKVADTTLQLMQLTQQLSYDRAYQVGTTQVLRRPCYQNTPPNQLHH